MLEKGLVTRTADVNDRRRQLIEITEHGQAIIDENKLKAVAISEQFVDILGQDRYEALLDSLQTLDNIR